MAKKTISAQPKEYLVELQKKLNMKNINEVPKIAKVIVSMGIGSLVTRKGQKDFQEFEKNLIRITGQKAHLSMSKKAISNFKLREGLPVMLKTTLRKQKALDFITRLVRVVLPRIRDFGGLSTKSFDKQYNLSIGIKNYNIFPELSVEDITIPMGLGITIVPTKSHSVEQSKALLESLGLVFK